MTDVRSNLALVEDPEDPPFEMSVGFGRKFRLRCPFVSHHQIVIDANGNRVAPPLEVDLAHVDSNGDYPRTIIKTADPDRYGINIGDCIV